MEPQTKSSNWSENQIKYARFLGRGKRDVTGVKWSNEKFAEHIGVHFTSLYDWKNLPGFKQLVFEFAVADHVDKIPDLIIAQVAKATGQELLDSKGKKVKPGDTTAFMALMRQFELLKADKVDTKQEVHTVDNALD